MAEPLITTRKPAARRAVNRGHPVNSIIEDNQGHILFGTREGIDILDKKSGEFIQLNNNTARILRNENINKLIIDKRGFLWAATTNGLFLLDENYKTIRIFKLEDGLPENIINSIVEDNYGNLWMGMQYNVSYAHGSAESNGAR